MCLAQGAEAVSQAGVITIVLADDHALFRRGLRSMLELEPDLRVVGEAADGLEVQARVDELHPDLVLLDINMPQMDGIDAARALRRNFPYLGIVMLTMFGEDEVIERALAAGADGYLRKDTPFDDIVATVRATAAGRPDSTAPLGNASALPLFTLTDEVLLRLVMDGLTDQEIAVRAASSESNVRERLGVLYRRLGVKDRTQAAIYAITRGTEALPGER
jgi:DNA-binding NarL/FixJ family response regulator